MNAKLLAVLALIVAVLIAAFALFGGGAPQGPSPVTAPVGGERAPVTPGADAAVQAPVGEVGAGAGEQGRQLVSAGQPAGAAQGGQANPRTAVRGRLVDATGAAVAGLTVTLLPFRASPDFPALPLPGRGNDAEVSRSSMVSGDDGRFEFPVDAGQGGVITVADDRRLLQKGRVTFAASRVGTDLGDLPVVLAAAVAGVVRDPAGRPVPEVKVTAHADDGMPFGMSVSVATTDAEGRFRLERLLPGKIVLRTASAHFLPERRELQLTPGQQVQELVLVLREGQAISGQVIDDRGFPIPGAKVGAMRREERGAVSMQRFSPDEATETDAGGWFTLSGLTGEGATVRAWSQGFTTVTEPRVPLGTGNVVLQLHRLGSVAGVLRDRSGAPIAGSRVSATAVRRAPGPMGSEVLDDVELPGLVGARGGAVTATDGSFRLDDVAPGEVVVRARGSDHRPAEAVGITVRAGLATEGVMLVADRGATLRATVVDAAGRPVAGARVTVTPPPAGGPAGGMRMRTVEVEDSGGHASVFDSSSPRRLGEGTTDGQGVAEIGGLPEGAAQVEASHSDLAEARPVLVTLPAAGAVEARLTLRQGGQVEVTVTDHLRSPLGGARFVVRGPLGEAGAERDRRHAADAEGRARVGPLPAGNYFAELVLDASGRRMGEAMVFTLEGPRGLRQSRATFVVAEGGVVAVDLVRPVLTRLEGTVSDADGAAAGIEVELEPVQEGADNGPPATRSVRTAADGSYTIDELEAGRYQIRYGRPTQMVKASEEIEVPANTESLRRDLRLRSGKVRIAVRSKRTGEPIEGAEVSLLRGGEAGRPRERRMVMISMTVEGNGPGETTTMAMGNQRVKTDVDGVAQIEDVPAGTWLVQVSDRGHARFDLPDQVVTEGATTDCGTVQLEEAGRVRGRVLGADGQPVQMAMVTYRPAGSTAEPEREMAMGGAFTLNGLRAGKYLLRAVPVVLGPGNATPGPEVEVEVVPGRVGEVELSLPPR